uniref:Late blight resistance protein homolog R1B-12 n=1 Tax=Nicotiana tabacum TaxID=4097 RepID=A0A1S4BV06_TOBAC|nr:PREDICTED: putative late blight resistance protein homolog R1B-12 [Nicotiana tabacum]XP_016492711.1 PREDICTED: putative late blight resistance protein homolog R1B-12 [Nicotiana tabacum]
MAAKCSMVHDDVYDLKKREDLDSWTIDQLDDASTRLVRVELFLRKLEEVHPKNTISAQLGALFVKAHKGFSEIPPHIKDQHRRRYTIRTLISDVLGKFKLVNTAEPLKASEASRSTSQIISDVLEIIKLENIAKRMEASKPSRSSCRISTEMVRFVRTVLDCTASCLYRVHHRAPESVLKKKLPYLRVFLTLTAERCIEHESMKDFFTHVEDVAYTAANLCLSEFDSNRDSKFSKLLKRISPFRPKIKQIYLSVLIGSKSSRSETTMNANYMSDFLKALQEDLQELLNHDARLKIAFDDPIPWLQQGLSYLSGFLLNIASKCTPLKELNSLQSHVEALAIETAILIYSSYDEEMDKTTEIDHVLFHLQPKFNHVKIEVDLIQLLNCQATIIAPLKDLTDYVWGELIYLGTFIMDSLEQCKEHTKIADFVTLIQSVTSQACSVINSLFHYSEQEDLAREINYSHFQLLLKFKFIKAAIAQMCSNISASSTLDHPTIDLWNFLPINFEIIDSYFNMLKSSKISSSYVPTVDEVFMGFHEYVFGNLLLKDETYLTVTVGNEVKKFFYGLLLLVTYLFDPLAQSIGCMKQNDLLTGFGTTVIEAESAICLNYQDVADSIKSGKVNLVLQFLTIAFKLIESEGILTDILKHKATLKAQIFDLIESAHEELISVRAFLMDVFAQHTKLNELHDLLMRAEVTAHKLVQISSSCYESFMDGRSIEKMRLSLSDLQQEIESVKVDFRIICFQLMDASPCNMTDGEGLINFLVSHQDWLLKCDACSIPFLKNQIPIVIGELVYLGSFLADIIQYLDMHQELKDLVKRVQDRKYVCLFPIRDYIPACYYMLYLSDIKQLLKFVEAEVKTICLEVPDSSSYSFPTTNGLGFLSCFLDKLDELLNSKLDPIIDLKLHIRLVKKGLLCLRSLTDHFTESNDEHDEVYSLITSVTEVAYKAEYVIDSCLTFSHPLWYKVLLISEVVENIKLVNKEVSETCEREKNDEIVPEVAKTSTNILPSLSANTSTANKEMEGFQNAMNVLKNQLLEGSPQLDVISLVGVPGIGKTTLAKRIYNDPMVTSHFDVRAQCRVTQVYSWRDLLLTILNDVLEPVDRDEKEDGRLADELHRFLLTKRFLVLIDDVWDNEVWDNFHMCFKDAQNGSRIILTTQLNDIAIYAKCESEPHHLRLFSDDESWTLLQKEVFQGESCPPELVDVGFRIAKCCGGLPLFIVLVAGVLKEKKKKAELWKEIEESLGSQNIGSLEETMSIIGFSYKNLPHHLKPCFLYFGGFLKGKDIHVSKLIRIWIAEGFVQANTGKRPEDAAQGYLEDLISRNLVMDVEKRRNGKLKTCRIHDLLHRFCLEKAKKENFFLRINRFSEEDIFPEKPKEYRLFVHSYEDQIDLWQPSRSNVRSLLFNVINPDNFLWPRDISFIFDNFKLVKVLDLESFNIGGTFPSAIQSLIHLRYFAAQTSGNSIPSSIAKLWNLETFVVKGLGVEVILPSSLLKMVKLRHIHVKHRASFSLYENMGESLANSQLDNLETFSTPRLSYGEDTEMILRKMPKLRKLSCIFSGTFGYSKILKRRSVLFPRLEFLNHLESLKLISNSCPAKLPHVFSFPSRLRELTLSKFRLPWYQISTIAELPNLEILKLLLRAFEGDEWEVKDSEFPELKYLELDDLNIARWSVSEDVFPMLEHLVLTKCKKLKEIPSHFDNAISLRRIEVNWCSWPNSAQEIQRTHHEDMTNDALTIAVHPPDWTRGSSP